jgi:hypothetical protein
MTLWQKGTEPATDKPPRYMVMCGDYSTGNRPPMCSRWNGHVTMHEFFTLQDAETWINTRGVASYTVLEIKHKYHPETKLVLDKQYE